jgi:hypothetical protein
MTLLEIADRFQNAKKKKSGNGYTARCAAHDDRTNSLSIDANDKQVLVFCHAGCATENVVAAAGLELSDLFLDAKRSEPEPRPRILLSTNEYEIRDRQGTVVAVHVRKDYHDGTKEMPWQLPDGTSGLGSLKRSDLPLYGVDRLPDDMDVRIVVTEGEKACESLHNRRINAVGTVCSANDIPSTERLADLTGRHVVLWPDNDEIGRKHMAKLAAALLPIAASVAVATWSDAPAKGDAADYRGDPSDVIDAAEVLEEPPEPGPERGPEPEPQAGPTIGNRTAADLRWGPPPPQLVRPFLDSEGPTVLYGKGGAGKGVMTCWLAGQLVRSGHVVMVVDYEGHETEWGSRLRGLGLPEDELRRVIYRAPFGSDWTAPTGSLAVVAALLRQDCEKLGVTYLVVDSYSPATSSGDQMGGEAAAKEYFGALVRIGRPSLTIAHVRGDAEKFSDRPFGSVFVHNFARETWALYSESDADNDPDDPTRPVMLKAEARNQKKSGGPKARPQFLAVTFFADGTLNVSSDAPTGRPLAEVVDLVLEHGALTTKAIVAAIREDYSETVPEDSVKKVLSRNPHKYAIEDQKKRPHRWVKK